METAVTQFDFRTWMCEQTGDYKLNCVDERHYHLLTEKIDAQVNFYPVDDGPDIVEFRIDQNDETKFFLHFQPVEEAHTKSLFDELVHKMYSMENEKQLNILLCCSVGMTTTYFAEKLNVTAKQLEEDIGFNAVSVDQVYAVGEQYDAVLVAPQVGYMRKRLQEALPGIPVVQISAQIFGAYDAPACIKMVLEVIEESKKSKEDRALEHVAHHIENDKKLLIIAIMPNVREAWVRYRIFDHGRITVDKEVIKEKFHLEDLVDIIQTNMIMEKRISPIQAVGIAVPGMIHDGKLEYHGHQSVNRAVFNLGLEKDRSFNIAGYLREQFNIPVYMHNNANDAAVGWYGSQDKYKNIVFQSQAPGYKAGGQGIIADGHLITGAHDSSGEIRYIITHIHELQDVPNPVETAADMVKVVAASVVIACSVLDPEVVCIRSPMTPDMNEIKNELLKYLPVDHMPELIYINNMDEYVLLGEMIMVLLDMQKTNS